MNLANKLIYTVCFYFSYFGVKGQTVTLLDLESNLPIAAVVAKDINSELFEVSNDQGQLNLLHFNDSTVVFLSHPAYSSLTVSIKALQNGFFFLQKRQVQLEEIEISGNRYKHQSNLSSHSITSLSGHQNEFKMQSTSADLLQSSGEVHVQKSQLGGGSPMIRGFAANSVLLLLDGIRINNAISRSGNLHNIISIPNNAIDRFEIYSGPGSVIFGSDALGGAINMVTIPLSLQDSVTANMGGIIYASATNERTANFSYSKRGKKLVSISTLKISKIGDLVSGRKGSNFGLRHSYVTSIAGRDSVVSNDTPHKLIGSGYSSTSAMSKLKWLPNRENVFTATALVSKTSDIPRYDRLTERTNNLPKFADWHYGPQQLLHTAIKLENHSQTKTRDGYTAQLYYQQWRESRHSRHYQSIVLRNQMEKVDAVGFNLDFFKTNSVWNIYYGIENRISSVNSTANEENIQNGELTNAQSRYPDGRNHFNINDAYLKFEKRTSNSLSLNGGLRFGYSGLIASSSSNTFNANVNLKQFTRSGQLGLVWSITNMLTVKSNISTGYRVPNLDDVGKFFESNDDILIVPNSRLRPESALNTDIELIYRRNKFSASWTAYRIWVRDLHAATPVSHMDSDSTFFNGQWFETWSIVNQQKATITGFNLNLTFAPSSHSRLNVVLSDNNGINKTTGENIRHSNPLLGKISYTQNFNHLTIKAYSLFNSAVSIREIPLVLRERTASFPEEGYPAWATYNLYLNYKVAGIDFSMSIENIGDLNYRTYSSGINAPGRNFIFSVRYPF